MKYELNKILKMTDEEYFRIDAISGTDLVHFSRKPNDYILKRKQKPTDAMLRGTMVHTALLEPQEFDKRYVVEPTEVNGVALRKADARGAMRLTSEGKEFLEKWKVNNGDKIIVDAAEMRELQAMKNSFNSHEIAPKLFKGAHLECVVISEINGVLIKGKVDAYNEQHGILTDLKTTRNAEPQGFETDSYRKKYHLKMAFYKLLLEKAGKKVNRVMIAAIEKDGLCDVCVREMSPELLDRGYEQAMNAFAGLVTCKKQDKFPGWDTVVPLGIPAWATVELSEEEGY